MSLTQESGQWPSVCMTCQEFLRSAGFSPDSLKNMTEGLREKVAQDVQKMETLLEKPARGEKRQKGQPQAADAPPSKQIKKEAVQDSSEVKKEKVESNPEVTANASNLPEDMMSKAALVELHQLEVLEKKTNKKMNPVRCSWCDTVFEGRNKAKILQHVGGAEHRRRWKLQGQICSVPSSTAQSDPDMDLKMGKCKGLRLQSSIGAKTRLGTDLRPVWDVYTKYANLERTRLA